MSSQYGIETDEITLQRYVLSDQKKHPTASGDLTNLLTSLLTAVKAISSAVRKAGLAHIQGIAGRQNVQGEEVKKLDSIGEFILTHPQMKIPKKGSVYSVNEAYASTWSKGMSEYIRTRKFPEEGHSKMSLRYVGSMVADLRMLYESLPMAFLTEQVGGIATTGKGAVLDLVPEKIHSRCPIILGSPDDVNEFLEFLKKYDE
ncbi:unnamed protein product [Anisakis simplex]|uniref:D-fructose-1,6-bisphosphate 1-phosphohydrolase n=1 Tax=Anisakis simplex TaxID=6269 RepID=A0A0M3JSV6_ANISI|nr:unnamed protein product [Anisakis simplex]